jgi:ParB family chromosome partitioning protein
MIGLLKLPEIVILSVSKGDISMGHARVLSKLESEELILDIYKRIMDEKLTVREVEEITQRHNSEGYSKFFDKSYLDNVKANLRKSVDKNIAFDIKKNKIVFSFKTKEELDRIIHFLKHKL